MTYNEGDLIHIYMENKMPLHSICNCIGKYITIDKSTIIFKVLKIINCPLRDFPYSGNINCRCSSLAIWVKPLEDVEDLLEI